MTLVRCSPEGERYTRFDQFYGFNIWVEGVHPAGAPVQVSLMKMPEKPEEPVEEAGSRFVAVDRNVM